MKLKRFEERSFRNVESKNEDSDPSFVENPNFIRKSSETYEKMAYEN